MMTHQLRGFVNEILRPLRNRVYMMISRAVIEAARDGQGIQIVKLRLLADESRDDIERFQNFGFTSVPPDGSEALAAAVGGNREHLIVVACDDRRIRVKNLAKGESAVYTDDGTIIHLKKGGLVNVIAAAKVTVTCPLVEMSGNATVKGNLLVEGNSQVNGNETVGSNVAVAGNVTATNVSAGAAVSGAVVGTPGTDLDTLKNTYNSHTHNETGTVTGGPNQTV